MKTTNEPVGRSDAALSAPRRWIVAIAALLVAMGPACAMRYAYQVPARQLSDFDVTRGPITLQTADGAVVRTQVERVEFANDHAVDLGPPPVSGVSRESSEAAARITREALDHPRGVTQLIAADRRNYAPTIGLVTGLIGGSVAGVALCAAGGGDAAGICMAVGGPIAGLAGLLTGWGLGALVGYSMTYVPTAATLVDPSLALPGRTHQDGPQQSERPPQLRRAFRPRGRFAVGGLLTAVRAPLSGGIEGDGVGIYLRGGIQLSEGFGIDLDGAFAAFVTTGSLRVALTFMWTWDDWFSVGVGLSGTRTSSQDFLDSTPGRSSVLIAVPLRFSFFSGGRTRGGARHGFEFAARVDLGGVPEGHFGARVLGGSVSLEVGYLLF